MNKTVAIIQSSYIPWKGYFDIIHQVDTFIFLEDVQYTVRDWRSRNRIRTPEGSSKWLTIPILGGRNQMLYEAMIDNNQNWQSKHLAALRNSYSKAPFFSEYYPELASFHDVCYERLTELNQVLTKHLARRLGIAAEFQNSLDVGSVGRKDDKLIALILAVGGTRYVSGPRAADYIDTSKFQKAGIDLIYADYSQYPEYKQISEPFEHYVSILDMLFMLGPDTPNYIWGHKEKR